MYNQKQLFGGYIPEPPTLRKGKWKEREREERLDGRKGRERKEEGKLEGSEKGRRGSGNLYRTTFRLPSPPLHGSIQQTLYFIAERVTFR